MNAAPSHRVPRTPRTPWKRPELRLAAAMTVTAFSVMYSPQPMLPTLRAAFGVDTATASLMVTGVLIPLGFAPLAYGYLLESFPVRRMMALALAALALAAAGIALAESFPVILALRFVQGLAVPALLTSLMTFVPAVSEPEEVPANMAFYVAATIFGGFFGRAVSGLLTSALGWRFVFWFLAAALLACLAALRKLPPGPNAAFTRIRLRDVRELLAEPGFLRICGLIGCGFFVYASMPNFLPFRLRDLSETIPEWRIGLTYSGYLLGMVVSSVSPRIVSRLGGERRALIAGLILYLGATLGFSVAGVWGAFAVMYPFCGAMALLQGVCPGFVNRRITARRGLANGVYLCVYYLGGSMGSYLPGGIYQAFGWEAYVGSLGLVLCVGLWLAWGLHRDSNGVHECVW